MYFIALAMMDIELLYVVYMLLLICRRSRVVIVRDIMDKSQIWGE